MKCGFKAFFLIWLIFLIVFNICVFVIPKKNGSNFNIIYYSVLISFIIELIVGYLSLNQENSKKSFYYLPLICVSSIGLLILLMIGIIGVFIVDFPMWIVLVICVVIIGLILGIVVAVKGVADNANEFDERRKK